MSERKRIIYLIDGLGSGGAERLLLPYMRYLNKERFEPRVCALQVKDGNPIASQLEEMDIPVDLLPIDRLRDLSSIPRIVQYIKNHNADLMHTQLEFSNTLGNTASKILNLPSICTIHTLDAPKPGSKTSRRLKIIASSEAKSLIQSGEACSCSISSLS